MSRPAACPAGDAPCWQSRGTQQKLRDPKGGLNALTIAGGATSRILVRGLGPLIDAPFLPLAGAGLTVQLQDAASGRCWGADFPAAALRKNFAGTPGDGSRRASGCCRTATLPSQSVRAHASLKGSRFHVGEDRRAVAHELEVWAFGLGAAARHQHMRDETETIRLERTAQPLQRRPIAWIAVGNGNARRQQRKTRIDISHRGGDRLGCREQRLLATVLNDDAGDGVQTRKR